MYVLEFSKKQKQYHIQTVEERKNKPENGYKVIGYYSTRDEAFEALSKLPKTKKTR